jgi:glycosyltransferase involved in cell wall biosynthesis
MTSHGAAQFEKRTPVATPSFEERDATATRHSSQREVRVCVVGSGTRFISGISYYTYYLSNALSEGFEVSVVLMRRLLPRFLYPGRKRVGAPISKLKTSTLAPTFDGVDWFSVPSLFKAGRFLREQNPDVVIFQWWTGAVLHSFLYLLGVARRRGASIVLEFHEDQDTGEAALPWVGGLVKPGLNHLIRSASHYVVHSEWDRKRLGMKFNLDPTRMTVIPHGPYPVDEHADRTTNPHENAQASQKDGEVTILFFGTIRPYKGAEDLVDAFNQLPRDGSIRWRLVVAGETWEGWELPGEKIRDSPFLKDIDFVNRYVTDEELPELFDRADIVALPYHRSSASGPLHMTMHRGIPVVVTDVGGLSEAAADYTGTVFVPPADPAALARGILAALDLRADRHVDVHTWELTRASYAKLFRSIGSKREPAQGETTPSRNHRARRPIHEHRTLQTDRTAVSPAPIDRDDGQ